MTTTILTPTSTSISIIILFTGNLFQLTTEGLGQFGVVDVEEDVEPVQLHPQLNEAAH